MDNALWWDVWWPGSLFWIGTLVLAVATGLMLWGRARSRRGRDRRPPEVALYLDNEAVMGLYMSSDQYKLALRTEVTKKRSRGWHANAAVKVGDAGWKTEDELVAQWVAEEEPITVIRTVMGVIEKFHDMVTIDLPDGVVLRDAALNKVIKPGSGPTVALPRVARKSLWYSIYGEFRETEPFVFEAPCAPGDDAPVARCRCKEPGLRGEVPDETFQARCLGKVRWDEEKNRLTIRPVLAIFE